MSVLIHGLKMPQEGFVEVLIRDDGTVQQTGKSYRIDGTDYYTPYVGEMPVIHKAIPIQPHGRLIDADALKASMEILCDKTKVFDFMLLKTMNLNIDNAPTVVQAERFRGATETTDQEGE